VKMPKDLVSRLANTMHKNNNQLINMRPKEERKISKKRLIILFFLRSVQWEKVIYCT
jgi:hypothetical protein